MRHTEGIPHTDSLVATMVQRAERNRGIQHLCLENCITDGTTLTRLGEAAERVECIPFSPTSASEDELGLIFDDIVYGGL